MNRTRRSAARNLAHLAPFLVLAFSLLFVAHCQLPAGCGPGAITASPYVGNLVDYTDPPSGMILSKDDFQALTVHFFVPVDAATFDPASQVRVFEIDDRWEAVDEGRAWTEHPVQDLFAPAFESACEDHPVCDPADPRYRETLATRIVLSVAAPELLQAGRSYRVEFLGECSEDPEDPTACTTSPLLSWDGVGLATNVDLLFGLVEPGSEPPDPYDCLFLLTDPMLDAGYYTMPHQKIRFIFSRPLGFANFAPSRQDGLYFAHRADRGWLETDSIQGLTPGVRYEVDFLSSDLAPAGSPPGIPYTMDRWGNALRPWEGFFHCTDEPETVGFAFQTSHARILFPLHTPFSNEPDDWGGAARGHRDGRALHPGGDHRPGGQAHGDRGHLFPRSNPHTGRG